MHHFPLLVCYDNDDELTVLPDATSLQQWWSESRLFLTVADRIIDSRGTEWIFTDQQEFQISGKDWTLGELTLLAQQHFAAQSSSCAAKINAPDIARLLRWLADAATD